MAHLDLYRFETLGEADWADLEPYFDDAVAFVEWPEAGKGFLPEPRLRVLLRLAEGDRRLIAVQKSLENKGN